MLYGSLAARMAWMKFPSLELQMIKDCTISIFRHSPHNSGDWQYSSYWIVVRVRSRSSMTWNLSQVTL